jgi:hypothetical protein
MGNSIPRADGAPSGSGAGTKQYVVRRHHSGYGLLYMRGSDPRTATPNWDLGAAARFPSPEDAEAFLARMPPQFGGKELFEVCQLPA